MYKFTPEMTITITFNVQLEEEWWYAKRKQHSQGYGSQDQKSPHSA